MTAILFYFAANVVTITIVALVAAAYLISQPRAFNARIMGLVALSTASYLVARMTYAFGPDLKFNFWPAWPVLGVLMNIGSGFWMILCHSLFQDSKRFPRWLLVVFGLQVCLSGVGNVYVLVYGDGSAGFLLGDLPIAMQIAFSLIALYWIVRGWRADLLESRRILRWVFLGLLGGLYLGVTTTELAINGMPSAVRLPWDNTLTLVLAATAVLLAFLCLRFDPGIFVRVASKVSATPEPGPADEQQDADLERFYQVFRDQKSYLEPGLSVAGLAHKLAMPQYRLRALINRRLGYRNFNALLHQYSIADAGAMLADPAKNDQPILTIALTVGYQSIAPFNQAFRDKKGMTPSAFRQLVQQSGLDETSS